VTGGPFRSNDYGVTRRGDVVPLRARPRPGMVTLEPERGSSLTLILNAPPDRAGGVGGWETSERILATPATWWKAPTQDTMSLDCLLDIDAIGGPSLERRLRVLRDMAQPGGEDEPPWLQISGDLWDSDQNVRWVIQDLKLGDRLYIGSGGGRGVVGGLRRQQVTVDLIRYVEVEEVDALRVRRSRLATGKRRRRTYVVRRGDTLRAIALRELGDASLWRDLRKWNKSVKRADPDATLRTGLHLKLQAEAKSRKRR
jgi:hypothetical protein